MDSLGASYAELNIQELSRMRASFESNVITFSAEKQEITIASASPQGYFARGSSMNEAECKTGKVSLTANKVVVEGSGFGSVTLENLDNSSKIIGDYFLGLIYERLCSIFNTESWKVSVGKRLDAVLEGVPVPGCRLHEATTSRRQIVHDRRRVGGKRSHVDDVDVGAEAGR